MKHVVTLNAGAIYIKNSGVVFQIVHDDYSIKETFGKLKVTNTSIEWMPKNTKGKGIKLKWKEFDELMKTSSKLLQIRKHLKKQTPH